MATITPQMNFFIELAKARTIIGRRFDNRLSFRGLGFSEFLILLALEQSPHQKMRRIDLAQAIGLTASGITRLLLPMEKIGLVIKEANEQDARVSYVILAPGGKEILEQSIVEIEALSESLLTDVKEKNLLDFTELLIRLGKTVVY